MSYRCKRWNVTPPAPEDVVQEFSGKLGLSPLMAQILFNRGIGTRQDAEVFLDGEGASNDPFQLKGMHRAVHRIRQALRAGESIAVYGDFDVDGITATAVLTETLRALGAKVRPYIPNRFNEGYGLNKDALRGLAADGVTLVVTVDCGIRSPEEIADACKVGLDVIVTDHHSVGMPLPGAVAVINPKQSDCLYGFPDLAGVGVAFKLAQALLRVNDKVPVCAGVTLVEKDLLDLVALGTVADLVPLVGENRVLVKRGLRVLREMRRPGIRAMIELAGLRPERMGASAISFVLGPRLNAAGRLDDAITSYEILTSPDADRVAGLAHDLEQTNRERQRKTIDALETARQQILTGPEGSLLLVAADPGFPPGIVGLVAGRLTEEFYRPAIVIEVKDDYCRGSARSIDEFDITGALDCCQELLERHGGHALAAGFTVKTERLDTLLVRLHQIALDRLGGLELLPSVSIDAEVRLSDMSRETVEHLQQLEPVGTDNPPPLFMSRHLTVRNVRTVGAEGQHLKLSLYDGRTTREAIGFGLGALIGGLPNSVDAVYALELNDWNGEERLQLRLEDLRPTQ